MIIGTPYQNLSEKEAQEMADVFFKSSIEMAINTLQSGLYLAKKQNNLKLAELIEKDIATYMDMHTKRELLKG